MQPGFVPDYQNYTPPMMAQPAPQAPTGPGVGWGQRPPGGTEYMGGGNGGAQFNLLNLLQQQQMQMPYQGMHGAM